MMLLRGQNLVAYRNHPDDVAEAFVERAAINGIDVFRTFDAVNDLRNLEVPAKMVKKMGKHFQGVICYSLTEPRHGRRGVQHRVLHQEGEAAGGDGSGHGMHQGHGGLISPYDAYMLVKALKESVKVPNPSTQPFHLGTGGDGASEGDRGGC